MVIEVRVDVRAFGSTPTAAADAVLAKLKNLGLVLSSGIQVAEDFRYMPTRWVAETTASEYR